MSRRSEAEAELSEAAQGYLLALRSMTSDGATTMVSALARRMRVSTQAASEMVARLSGEGLVKLSEDRELSLTEAGLEAADQVFRRHALLEWLLIKVIGLGWAESDEEAARLQGAISTRVQERIEEMLGRPPTCPHGNPIDAASARRRPRGIRLSEAPPGSQVTIYRITEEAEEETDLLVYLEHAGLVPGTVATVSEVSTSRDSIIVDGPRGQASLGLRPASLIRVLPGRADPALFHQVPERIGQPSRGRGAAG
jgi:DtxR family Mn-dependent transcriptional regulator